jgi:hypothetical protein
MAKTSHELALSLIADYGMAWITPRGSSNRYMATPDGLIVDDGSGTYSTHAPVRYEELDLINREPRLGRKIAR